MKTTSFDFEMGSHTMPTDPVELRGRERTDGRMIVLDRGKNAIEHRIFSDIYDYFRAGDLLVLNDSYMLSNTLQFTCGGQAATVIVYGHESDHSCMVEVRPRELAKAGLELRSVDDEQLSCTLLASYPDHIWKAKFEPTARLIRTLEGHGTRSDETVPLNPSHWQENPAAYRSVYAKSPGSLEIPSAGLHFSTGLLDRIAAKGVEFAYVTLHVGSTEVLAVRHIDAEHVEDHRVREEFFDVQGESAAKISRALAEGRRIVAVGTTVVRTLESLAASGPTNQVIMPQSGWTGLYIYPGYHFKIVDALLTNLHRPRSSHIVLTAAFAGQELLMRGYDELLSVGGYEFDMFGDSMLIV
ncbi:S-adenosylmethionine:tRNA ribosyltransferase-isomerase [Massilia sp. CCM 8734]|uniref:S-adenosylmethionine:tRNA ribosyltransferase-isomerase n=1 Tax=Massilia sp. CCM 8734 TaxID=2609283 RepID=UPI001420A9E6|nr:S-adenosylmethionine:tRNA ribosyltransferase-isomerase [Massilia sp. CCM 8734]NHZ94238.1 S-adenosylmethionine:tRNA ribosyltransferase-isomerase [Massilia sp. CCM 8734]